MTDIYEAKRKQYEGDKLRPYPHVEKGVEHGRAIDPVGYLHSVEQRARERQVAVETVKILRQRVIHCYRAEGVNSIENCKEINEDYFNLIQKKDVGQLQPNWSDPKMMDGW